MKRFNRAQKNILLLASSLCVFGGGLVLFGWAYNIPLLKSLHPDWVSMKVNSALGFILGGLGVLANLQTSSRWTVFLSRIFALLCGLVGVLTLCEYIFSWDFGIDQLLFPEPAGAVGTSHPGRMAPDAAASFLLLSIGLLLSSTQVKTTMLECLSVAFGVIVIAFSSISLSFYFIRTVSYFGFWGLTMMAAHTAVLFVLLGTATIIVALPKATPFSSLKGRTQTGCAVWTLMLAGVLAWSLHQQGLAMLHEATITARANINKDMAFRKWASSHGGVYVSPSEVTPPNPYLKVAKRDVVTNNGDKLTLMNPAYMLREMQQFFGKNYGMNSNITSLNPLNPSNTPDLWEKKALTSFEKGEKELMEPQYMDGKLHIRFMLPFITEANCLKCHAHQGFKVGDIRGGISTAVPLAPFLARSLEGNTSITLSFGTVWLIGIISLLLFYRRQFVQDDANMRSAIALRDSEERFRLAFENANVGVCLVDNAGNLTKVNSKICEILGYSQAELEAITLPDITLQEANSINLMFTKKNNICEILHSISEQQFRHKNGSVIWCFVSISAIKDSRGNPDNFILHIQDITKNKQADADRKKLEDRLRQAQKMEAIGTLAGGIAHDFNNILGAIFGYAEMAKDDAPPGTRFEKDLDKVLIAATRAKDLVKQILAFSRQDQVERIPVKIQPLIKEGLKMLRSSIPTTISIIEDIDPKSGIILADPTHLHQILMNLCTNAYQAMEETGGTLSVSLKTTVIGSDEQKNLNIDPGEYVELIVSDTGVGVGPDVIGKIFDPYFTTKGVGKGTGMGLAIIHGIVQEYGGTITVESELGKGSTFHVYFPLVEEDALPEIIETEDIPRGKERVLFIDDEELLVEMGRDMLERLGYHVTVRRNSLEALTTFQNSPDEFDIVITDQTMPEMTGSDLARRMMQIRPDIPVILCTGYSNLIDEQSAKAMGIKEFTLKPLTKSVLAKLIRKVLDAS